MDNPPWDGADGDCEYEYEREEEEEEEEDESVPMEIDDGPDPEQLLPQTTSTLTPSLIVDDDDEQSEGEPMEIDDDMPSPVTPTLVGSETPPHNVMSISHILNPIPT